MHEAETIFLLDLENVPKPSLDRLPRQAGVVAFVNDAHKLVPRELLNASTTLKGRFELVSVPKGGKNSMDFHIAYQLGRILTKRAASRCVIVSRDTGFDALVASLRASGHVVSRTADIEPGDSVVPDLTAILQRAVELIRGTPAKSRPRTSLKLGNKLASELKSVLHPAAAGGPSVQVVIAGLTERGVLAEENGRLTYRT
jgi:hypothetical protein